MSSCGIKTIDPSLKAPRFSRLALPITFPQRISGIESLVKKNGTEDDGIIKELLVDFYSSSGKRKPDHVIIFRDGVSESQFNQVLNIELAEMDGDMEPPNSDYGNGCR